METIKLSPMNVTGCNTLRVNEDDGTISGLIAFDLEAQGRHIVLEFPNPQGIAVAIEGLQTLRNQWREREGK